MKAITVKEFILTDHGDPSVGIFPKEWKLTGEFLFLDSEELEEFKEKLSEAMEFVSDYGVQIDMIYKEPESGLRQFAIGDRVEVEMSSLPFPFFGQVVAVRGITCVKTESGMDIPINQFRSIKKVEEI